MRFMVIMYSGVYQPGKKIAPHFVPKAEKMEPMMKFNTEMKKEISIIALDGLHPLSKGARLSFAGGKATVTEGPSVEAKEVVGGYWMLEAKSKEQVVNWMKRCPAEPEDVIEIRQVFEMSDFFPEAQKAVLK